MVPHDTSLLQRKYKHVSLVAFYNSTNSPFQCNSHLIISPNQLEEKGNLATKICLPLSPSDLNLHIHSPWFLLPTSCFLISVKVPGLLKQKKQ